MKEDGVASALRAKVREWIAGLGIMGCIIAIASLGLAVAAFVFAGIAPRST